MGKQLYPSWWASRFALCSDSGRPTILKSHIVWRSVIIVILLCTLLFLTYYHLDIYPAPWPDEGLHLLASKALAINGIYAFGPSVGPTIFFPVALAMRIFGADLIPARLVMTLYLLFSVAVFYGLARQLNDWKTSLVAAVLYVVAPGISPIYAGRQVLGEVPAVLFTLAGILVWYRALDKTQSGRPWGRLVLAGILFGLACISKNQFSLLFPAWLALWVLNRLYYRQTGHLGFAIPLLSAALCIIVWYIAQWLFFPYGQRLASYNLSEWTSAPSRGILIFSKKLVVDNIRYMVSHDALYGWILPACLYAFLCSLRRSREGLQWAVLLTIAAVWLGWFTFFSVGWARYALLIFALSSIFLACFFSDMTDGYRVSIGRLASMPFRQWDAVLVGRAALAAVLVLIVAQGLVGRLTDVVAHGSRSAQQMAAYITEHVPGDAIIEASAPEICFLSKHTCHLPPSAVMDASIKHISYEGPPPSDIYHPQQLAAYLLIGNFGRWAEVYDMSAVKLNYELETTIGDYDLYRLRRSD